jgi:hypothetical protein
MSNLLENLWIKIAAAVLAILLWFHVATEKIYQNDYILPLDSVELTGDLVLNEPPPDSVRVTVSAIGKRLLRTDWKKRGMKLVASRSHPGRFKVDITPGNMSFVKAEEVELVDILEPREIILSCDRNFSKEVPVTGNIKAVPDEGFMISGIDSLVPDKVVVMGPKVSVEPITAIETSEHVFESARNDFSQTVALVYPEVYNLKIEPDTVRVFVTVEPIKRKDFGDISIRLVNFPVGVNYSVSAETVNLRLSGTAEAIDDLRPEQIAVVADYVLIDNSGKIPVQIIVPEGIKVLSQSTDSIIFTLQ